MKEIQRISITDAVVENVKELIESGEYEPGQKLPAEASLCQMMGVSRTSVREAFRVLQALGYVVIKPGLGAFAAEKKEDGGRDKQWYEADNAELSDFKEVRYAVETLGVRLAVERVSAEQIKELAEIQKSFTAANETHDMAKLIMLDELFHTKIISYTKNPLLIAINKQLTERLRSYRGESFADNEVYGNAAALHEAILSCFKKRDAEQAVAEMKRHLDITYADIQYLRKK
ncbi:FadR family transcriptional regulator [Lacrimispora sp. NSJ-141]|uniref:FadR family transcriptional regulator n=1 Tax=Lientehia hominis TaxID=2897778 RepID=A0AAP2W9N0_9FIRM|nr:FadR/GntR family transcriptional regulator [Lientehia hominis]MCD2493481.1 FadR family transcriptional regulator [Lientehia hominis]